MSYHFSMGAINKSTNNYEQPKIAIKSNKYKSLKKHQVSLAILLDRVAIFLIYFTS